MCTLLLVGCNYGGESTTFEPEIFYDLPDNGVFEEEDTIRVVVTYKDKCAVERSYLFKDGKFSALRIKVYPAQELTNATLIEVAPGVSFSKSDRVYSATLTEGPEVASLYELSYDNIYDVVSSYYDNFIK